VDADLFATVVGETSGYDSFARDQAACALEVIRPNVKQNHMSLRIGQKVRLRSTGEVGVVVWTWQNVHGDVDAYVAFFGESFPVGKPSQPPGIMRYYERSLEPVEI
jgi:hypothetical protein